MKVSAARLEMCLCFIHAVVDLCPCLMVFAAHIVQGRFKQNFFEFLLFTLYSNDVAEDPWLLSQSKATATQVSFACDGKVSFFETAMSPVQ